MSQPDFPPIDEALRLSRLDALDILDSEPEEIFDALARAASALCGTPIALVTLIDERRQWFKANVGLPGVTQTPRELAFCAHTIQGSDVLEVEDASKDARFATNPFVVEDPGIRFYAGAPVSMPEGGYAGSICVVDRHPRSLSDSQKEGLRQLASAAGQALQVRRRANRALAETKAAHAQIARLYDSTPAMLHSVDASGRIITVSDTWLSTLGYTRDEVLGQLSVGFLSDDSRKLALDSVMPAFRLSGSLTNAPFQMRHKNGDLIDVLISAKLERDDAGQFSRSIVGIENISSRKAAEKQLMTSQSFLRRTEAVAGVGGWELDLVTNAISWSDQTCRLHDVPLGYRPTFKEAIGFFEPAARMVLENAVAEGIAHGTPWDLELPCVSAKGRKFWARAVGLADIENGVAVRLSGAFQDVSDRREIESELAESRERLKVTLESIADAVITTDKAGNVSWLNPVAETMTGWPRAHAIAQPLATVFDIVDEDTRLPVSLAQRDRALLISRHGEATYNIVQSVAPIKDGMREPLGSVLVFRDATDERRRTQELAHLATHDSLTGLPNRGEFTARLTNLLSRTRDDQSRHALMYVDLDRFKDVNDRYGHAAGDVVLRGVSALLQRLVRSRDTVARVGGDEFAIILEDCDDMQGFTVASRICEKLTETTFELGAASACVGASVGLIPLDARWSDVNEACRCADDACYSAKAGGRNQVHIGFKVPIDDRAGFKLS